uniref:Predicted protein n=1 Tax=Hordeum vulgare subsp. vulgare TaxID=112509 RepID=F2EG41_HORVV|nr:predicted protein [Hordeum vulgare subsp. vulgare]
MVDQPEHARVPARRRQLLRQDRLLGLQVYSAQLHLLQPALHWLTIHGSPLLLVMDQEFCLFDGSRRSRAKEQRSRERDNLSFPFCLLYCTYIHTYIQYMRWSGDK